MNLVDNRKEKTDVSTKRLMIMITVAIIILSITAVSLYFVIDYLKTTQFKFYVDKQKTKSTSGLFVFEEDGSIYVSISDIAPIVKYKFFNGGYKKYTEENSECYVEGEDEIVTFENGSDKIYKTPAGEVDYQLFTIDKPVKMIDNKLYISEEGFELAFNSDLVRNEEVNQIQIYTLPYLAEQYSEKYVYSAIANDFVNQKALRYGLLVTQDVENTARYDSSRNIKYGISDLQGNEIVGTKYTRIEFIESTQEFLVGISDNGKKKVGIITADGQTKISPIYDNLKQINKDLNLYLATLNNKQGIIEKNGKILAYLEFDRIGIDTKNFGESNILNPYILFDNAIPVYRNNKWGMIDIKGVEILPCEYDYIGCVTNEKSYYNTVVIPSIKGIVFGKDFKNNKNSKMKLYGIYNQNGVEMVPLSLETVRFTINNGREEYSMKAYEGELYDVKDYYDKYVRDKILL